ncbi:MAG: hypothetical protein CVV60_01835 [Tenericutes bacterium HGW-Tenericutes-5]|jgi:thiol-disulfide isomerase/thioredoxin|nr:MAG: hypothetical protein CVV60_01835 [Tenericutes bacterium HGW-Tenericutes-5]
MKKFEIFTARYCGKCRALKRRLIELKDELIEVDIVFRDIDIERSRAKDLKINGVPTLIYYINEEEVSRTEGSILEDDIRKILEGSN